MATDETSGKETQTTPTLYTEAQVQEKINGAVGARLQTEKEKTSALLAAKEAELNAVKSKAETADAYEAAVKEIHAGLLADIPEDRKSLIPSQLSVIDQVNYIRQNKAHLIGAAAPGTPPATPPAETVTKPNLPPSDKKEAAPPGAIVQPTDFKSAKEYLKQRKF